MRYWIILISLWGILSMIFCELAYAQSNVEIALDLAKCIIAECNHCDEEMKEPIASSFVLYKRMTQYNNNPYNKRVRTFKEQIRIYCAIFNDGAAENYNGPEQIERRRKILASTFEHPVYLDMKVTREYWRELELFCLAFIYDISQYTDPCPNSMHFGGDMDIQNMLKRGWVIDTQCSGLKNNFFRKSTEGSMIDDTDAFGGTHYKVLFRASPNKLRDEELLKRYLSTVVERVGMQALEVPQIYRVEEIDIAMNGGKFQDDGGLTGTLVGKVVLSSSHATLHTWPQQGKAVSDIYSCKEYEWKYVGLTIEECYEPIWIQISNLSDYLRVRI